MSKSFEANGGARPLWSISLVLAEARRVSLPDERHAELQKPLSLVPTYDPQFHSKAIWCGRRSCRGHWWPLRSI